MTIHNRQEAIRVLESVFDVIAGDPQLEKEENALRNVINFLDARCTDCHKPIGTGTGLQQAGTFTSLCTTCSTKRVLTEIICGKGGVD